jgi:hypothetical protein
VSQFPIAKRGTVAKGDVEGCLVCWHSDAAVDPILAVLRKNHQQLQASVVRVPDGRKQTPAGGHTIKFAPATPIGFTRSNDDFG